MTSQGMLLSLLLLAAVYQECYAQSFGGITGYIQRRAKLANMAAYPFKVGEYNTQVQDNYPLGQGMNMIVHFNPQAVGYVFVFDSNVISWNDFESIMTALVGKIAQRFKNLPQIYYPANNMNPNTLLPNVHVQTAGNAAGGAFFYQERQVINPPSYWQGKTIYGYSIHPDYRLSTGFAGVIFFPSIEEPSFTAPAPIDVYKTEEEKIMILDRTYILFFNKCPLDACGGGSSGLAEQPYALI